MGAGALAVAFLPGADPAGDPLEPPGFLNYWAHWDGAWYSELATHGYGVRAPESTAFFPLYPLLVRAGSSLVGGPALWGALISLLCTAFALYFVYRIAESLYETRAARASTLALAFFPTAFFLNAVYTEALFLVLTAGAVWAARVRGNLLLAGLFGALATATRNLGVLLLIPLFFEWVRRRQTFGLRGLAGLVLVPAGLVAYAVFLRQRFGDPLVFARQQSAYWERELTGPLTTLGRAWHDAVAGMKYVLDPPALFLGAPAGPSLEASNTLNLVFLVFFLLAMLVGFAVLPSRPVRLYRPHRSATRADARSPVPAHEHAPFRARGVPRVPGARLPVVEEQAGPGHLPRGGRRPGRRAHRPFHHLALGGIKGQDLPVASVSDDVNGAEGWYGEGRWTIPFPLPDRGGEIPSWPCSRRTRSPRPGTYWRSWRYRGSSCRLREAPSGWALRGRLSSSRR